MYACVCGKKPFLAGGNPFRPAINTVIRLDLPYNPHLVGDTQFSSTIFILYLSQPYNQLWCSFSELAYQTLTMMISLDVRMPFACLEYFASFDIISSTVCSQRAVFSTAKAGNSVIVSNAESVSLK